MQRTFGQSRIELVQGDIVIETVDAIVNAANSALASGGGVDGAIHEAAGPAVMHETCLRYPHGCRTGTAVISGAGDLDAKYIIHAVGPVWGGGQHGEQAQLRGAYRNSLKLAVDHDCKSISFPAISTGIYGYPKDQAASVAIDTCIEFAESHPSELTIRFVLFDAGTYGTFSAELEKRS